MKKTRSALILGLLLILASCSTTRHVEPGSYLLSKVSIRVDSLPPAELEQLGDLTTFLPQQPNTKLLGLFDWTLYVYSLSNPKSNSFLSRQLRKWGDPPVLYNAEEAEFGRANLTAAMYNLGYLKAKTELQACPPDLRHHARDSSEGRALRGSAQRHDAPPAPLSAGHASGEATLPWRTLPLLPAFGSDPLAPSHAAGAGAYLPDLPQ